MRKRCKLFSHEWSADVYVSYAFENVKLKVCTKCATVRKAEIHMLFYVRDLSISRIEQARELALGENWNVATIKGE